jgi:hypothetical protein
MRWEEVEVATAYGRHIIECSDGMGKSANLYARRCVCEVVRGRALLALREKKVKNLEVWDRDPDRLRRWVNQNKKSRHWPGEPMTLRELEQHEGFLREAMRRAEENSGARRGKCDFGEYMDSVSKEMEIARRTGRASRPAVTIFQRGGRG